jgi:hypothetical protein
MLKISTAFFKKAAIFLTAQTKVFTVIQMQLFDSIFLVNKSLILLLVTFIFF